MDKMKQRFCKTSYIVLSGLLLFLCIFFVMQILLAAPSDSGAPVLNPIGFRGEWSVDGENWIDLTNGIEDGYKTVDIRGHFSADIPVNERIWTRLEHIGIVLNIDGKPIFSANQPGSFPSGIHSPGYSWLSFLSPGITPDEEITITLTSYYAKSVVTPYLLTDSFYVGDGSGFFGLLLQKMTFFAFLSLFSIFSGALYLFEGAVDGLQKMPDAKRIALFGLYLLSGGLWCIPDVLYPYFYFYISPPWLAAFFDIAGMLLMPIALTLLIRFYMRGQKTRSVMTSASFLILLSILVFLLLQLLGVADLHETQFMIAGLALGLLIVGVTCIVMEIRRYHDTYLKLLLLTVSPVFVAILLDSVSILFYPFMPRRTAMQYGFGISFLFSIVQLVSYAKAQIKKDEAFRQMQVDLAESRMAIMLSQIQPHFLYNTLTAIKVLCRTDSQKAMHTIDHFAAFLRGNLDSLSSTKLIPFKRELTHTKHYLEIEQLRFADRLHIIYDTPVTDFLVPTLTLQPIVENAVHYGIMSREEGITVTIRSHETSEAWIVTVQDDGSGFDPLCLPGDKRSHIGISNVRHRLLVQCGGTLTLNSTHQGTTVILTIPKNECEE